MRSAKAVITVLLALPLAGCLFRSKPPAAKVTPVAPAPVARKTQPQPPPAPLSTPQTNVKLPPEQTVSPEALATTQPPDEPVLPPMPPRPAPRRSPPAAAPKPAETQQAPQIPAPETDRGPVQEVVSAADQKRFQDDAEDFKRQIRKLIEQTPTHKLTRHQISLRDRVNSFVKQSDDAQARGDMRQARELARLGLVLAKELQQ